MDVKKETEQAIENNEALADEALRMENLARRNTELGVIAREADDIIDEHKKGGASQDEINALQERKEELKEFLQDNQTKTVDELNKSLVETKNELLEVEGFRDDFAKVEQGVSAVAKDIQEDVNKEVKGDRAEIRELTDQFLKGEIDKEQLSQELDHRDLVHIKENELKEQSLIGRKPDEETLNAAVRDAEKHAEVVNDIRSNNDGELNREELENRIRSDMREENMDKGALGKAALFAKALLSGDVKGAFGEEKYDPSDKKVAQEVEAAIKDTQEVNISKGEDTAFLLQDSKADAPEILAETEKVKVQQPEQQVEQLQQVEAAKDIEVAKQEAQVENLDVNKLNIESKATQGLEENRDSISKFKEGEKLDIATAEAPQTEAVDEKPEYQSRLDAMRASLQEGRDTVSAMGAGMNSREAHQQEILDSIKEQATKAAEGLGQTATNGEDISHKSPVPPPQTPKSIPQEQEVEVRAH